MRLRLLPVLTLVIGGTTAQASFDLMLVHDNASGVMHRIDPISRTYLGSFAVPVFQSMAASYTQKTVYLGNPGGVMAYDYSTGEERPERSFVVPTILNCVAMSANQNTIYAGMANGNILSYDASNGTLTGTFAAVAGSSIQAMTPTADGRLIVMTGAPTGHNLRLFSGAGSQLAVQSVDASTALASNSIAYWTQVDSNDRVFFRGTQTGAGYNYSMLSRGSNTLSSVGPGSYSGFANLSFHMPGHSGGYLAGLDTVPANGFRVTRFTGLASPANSTVYSNILQADHAAIVLAPEPGTWAALGLGALALMRRRR